MLLRLTLKDNYSGAGSLVSGKSEYGVEADESSKARQKELFESVGSFCRSGFAGAPNPLA